MARLVRAISFQGDRIDACRTIIGGRSGTADIIDKDVLRAPSPCRRNTAHENFLKKMP
jgi:hypothetical protein